MKRLLLSLLTLGVVSAVAIGATRAYFTDQQNILGAQITTGRLSITDSSEGWMKTWNVSLPNVKPGDTYRRWAIIENDGTLDVGSLEISAINKTGDVALLDGITVSIYGQVDGFDQGIYTPDWGNGQPVNAYLNNVNILGTAVYRDSTAAHLLGVGKKTTVILDFKIPSSWDNTYMGKSVSFDLLFTAEQVH